MTPEQFNDALDMWRNPLVDAIADCMDRVTEGISIDRIGTAAIICTLMRVAAKISQGMPLDAWMSACVVAWEEAQIEAAREDPNMHVIVMNPKTMAKA